MARKPLPAHLEELITLLEAQDLTAVDRAKAIQEVRKRHPGETITWSSAMESAEFSDRWDALQELRTLALQDRETSAGIAGTRSAGTVLRRAGGFDGQNGRPVLDRSHRPLVEKHRGRW